MSVAEPKQRKEPQELLDELDALSDVDKQKLRMIARKYAAVAGDMDADDLLQEAIMKVHETDEKHRRTCPADVGALVFMKNVMRSLASNRTEWRKRRQEAHALEVTSTKYDLFAANVEDPNIASPEDILIGAERDAAFQEFLGEQCNECEKTEFVLLGSMDGLRGQELCDLAGVTKKELATIHKRISRMMDRFEKQRRDS